MSPLKVLTKGIPHNLFAMGGAANLAGSRRVPRPWINVLVIDEVLRRSQNGEECFWVFSCSHGIEPILVRRHAYYYIFSLLKFITAQANANRYCLSTQGDGCLLPSALHPSVELNGNSTCHDSRGTIHSRYVPVSTPRTYPELPEADSR
jgi:hypothetical protein